MTDLAKTAASTVEDEIYSRLLGVRSKLSDDENPYANDHTINRGDVSVYGLRGKLFDHKLIKNGGKSLSGLVRPGDVVNKANPPKDYAYVWYQLDSSEFGQEEFEDIRERGWQRVTRDEFWVRRWQVDSHGSIRNGNRILMCLPAEIWAKYDKEMKDFYSSMARTTADKNVDEYQELLDKAGVAAEMYVEQIEKDGVSHERRKNTKKS